MQALPPRSRALAVLGILGAIVALWTAGVGALLAVAERPTVAPRPRRPAPTVPPPARLALTPFPRTLDELRALHGEAERLPLDARIVAAFAEVRRVRGVRAPVAAARFERDHWVITLDRVAVGELPALASPADALPVLARAIIAAPPAAPDPTAPAHVLDLAPGTALQSLRALAPERPRPATDPPHPAAAARALAALLFEASDVVSGADPIASRALAAAAWARAAGTPAPDAEALIAFSMEYTAAARTLAAALPADDALRAYVSGDDARLNAPGATRPAVAYLRFRRLLDLDDPAAPEALAALPAGQVGTVAVAAYARRATWALGPNGRAAREAPSRVLAALEREAGVATTGELLPHRVVLARTAALVARAPAAAPWLDADVYAARARSAVETAVVRAFEFDLVRRADPRAAEESLAALGDDTPPAHRPLVAWLDSVLRAVRGDHRTLLARATGPAEFPGELRLQSLPYLERCYDRATLVQLVAHLDSRPINRSWLLHAVSSERLDPVWHRSLCRAALLEPELSSEQLDECRARDARPPGAPPPPPEDPSAVEARFLAEDARARGWMDSRAAHVRWLIAQHRELEAVPLARAWIAAHPDGEGLEPAFARTGLARAQLAHGDAAAAWESIEPALVTWQGGAMEMGVKVLVALGRTDEALALARRYAARYEGVDSEALVAEILWSRGDHDGAASALTPPHPDANLTDWNDSVGGAVTRALGPRPPEFAAAAARALVRRGVGVTAMESLTEHLDREGHAPQALAMHEALTAPGLRSLALLAARHRLRAHATSRAEADRWLASAAPPGALGPVAMFAFGAGDDALVFTAADSATADADGEAYLWLLRAAAWLRSPPDAAVRARLDAALATPTHPYHRMARYLLGAEPLDAMMSLAASDDRRAEVAFWVGYRAHCEGRLEEAAEWYRFVARRGPEQEGEVGWAMRPLRRWSDAPTWLDAVVDPWAQAHANAAPTAPAAATPVEAAPPERHAPGGHHHHRHHRHRRHHSSRRAAIGARS